MQNFCARAIIYLSQILFLLELSSKEEKMCEHHSNDYPDFSCPKLSCLPLIFVLVFFLVAFLSPHYKEIKEVGVKYQKEIQAVVSEVEEIEQKPSDDSSGIIK